MPPLLAWIVVAATVPAAAAEPARTPGVQASARATAEILRAETSDPEGGANAARRHVRRRGQQVAVEFE